MSRTEIDRMGVIRKVLEGRLSQGKAGELLGLGARKVRRVGKAGIIWAGGTGGLGLEDARETEQSPVTGSASASRPGDRRRAPAISHDAHRPLQDGMERKTCRSSSPGRRMAPLSRNLTAGGARDEHPLPLGGASACGLTNGKTNTWRFALRVARSYRRFDENPRAGHRLQQAGLASPSQHPDLAIDANRVPALSLANSYRLR